MESKFKSCSAAAIDVAQFTIAPEVSEADGYPQRRVQFSNGVIGLPDITYFNTAGYRQLKLDVYLPSDYEEHARPLIVSIHGGGWLAERPRWNGAFEGWPNVLASLAASGYVVASVTYRLSGEAPFPAAVLDVKRAIRCLRACADQYGIDKERVFVWGNSAGGQLAALVATSSGVAELDPVKSELNFAGFKPPKITNTKETSLSNVDISGESDRIQGAVVWYGFFNFVGAPQLSSPKSPETLYLGSSDPEMARLASAISHIDSNTPPMLIFHGEEDKIITVQQPIEFYEALKNKGIKTDLITIPGVGHSFLGATPEMTREASIQSIKRTFEFFDQLVNELQ